MVHMSSLYDIFNRPMPKQYDWAVEFPDNKVCSKIGLWIRATWSIYVHFIYGISSQTGSNSWKYLVVSLNELIPTLWYLSKPSRKLMLSFKPINAQHLGNLLTTRLCISYRTYWFWIDTQLLISHWSVHDIAQWYLCKRRNLQLTSNPKYCRKHKGQQLFKAVKMGEGSKNIARAIYYITYCIIRTTLFCW